MGAIYFDPSVGVAPMFRPPDGDQIINGQLELFSLNDFSSIGQLTVDMAQPHRLSHFDSWSPDGAQLLVSLSRRPDTDPWLHNELVVIDATTGEPLHFLGAGRDAKWSPDGTKIAFEDRDPIDQPAKAQIALYDLIADTKYVLESSAPALKHGASVETITNNVDHDWYYEGWSWSSDGQHLIILKDLVTAGFVKLFGRFEQPTVTSAGSRRSSTGSPDRPPRR